MSVIKPKLHSRSEKITVAKQNLYNEECYDSKALKTNLNVTFSASFLATYQFSP